MTYTPILATLLRGRMNADRGGTLPIHVVKRVVDEAGSALERIDLFNYGEPFLYRHLVEALRYIRVKTPFAKIAISTDGLQVRPSIEATIVDQRLLDWIIFSVDGVDQDTYGRYRIRGCFDHAFRNMVRFNERARHGYCGDLAVRRIPMERHRHAPAASDDNGG